MRNQATDASHALIASYVSDKFNFGCPLKKQSDKQHDAQRDESVQVKQRQRSVNRKLDPPPRGTLPVALIVDHRGLSFDGVTRLVGISNHSYGSSGKKSFTPM